MPGKGLDPGSGYSGAGCSMGKKNRTLPGERADKRSGVCSGEIIRGNIWWINAMPGNYGQRDMRSRRRAARPARPLLHYRLPHHRRPRALRVLRVLVLIARLVRVHRPVRHPVVLRVQARADQAHRVLARAHRRIYVYAFRINE